MATYAARASQVNFSPFCSSLISIYDVMENSVPPLLLWTSPKEAKGRRWMLVVQCALCRIEQPWQACGMLLLTWDL
jgi:hypothetical protein